MISVIIPAFNEEKGIQKCLYSILPQISAGDEIIVICSGCSDKTVEKAAEIYDNRIKIIVQRERSGKPSAINLGVRKSSGSIIVQTDGDVELEKDAIENLTYPLFDPNVVAVSGKPVAWLPVTSCFYDWTNMSYNKMHAIRLKESQDGKFWHLSGYLCAFRKDAFEPLPNAKGAVDAWMGLMLKKKGRIEYADDAIVRVKAPTNAKDFIAQKSRVRAGFLNLREQMKDMPRSPGSEIKSFLPEMLKIKITRWPQFIYCGFVYAYAWLKASAIRKKSLDKIWKTPTSTK